MACVAVTPVASMQKDTLRLTEIFYSLQGEARTAGLPTVFVRLTGCPLRCHYCDTAYAFTGGEIHHLDAILEQVASYRPRHICVTGGEPLAQPNCLKLLEQLCDAGYEVSLETSGALDVSGVDGRVSKVVDLKTPGSGEVGRNLYANLDHLTPNDQVKFVICSREDYDWAVSKLIEYRLEQRAGEVLFSPSHGQVAPRELAEWIVADNLPVRFQLQLHKILWNDEPGH
ncbi:7-carboxy-7-deazaguanine synthase [Pseudomonas oryzihabitans]|uniref:7-carboxy-7-deazaguanine synthase n=2 Tax=Pseudomonas TaxID=286 RepID=A0ABX3IPM5_9PSED|nr:7-carboxy-7-deazaguanine synthase [Pseudomonas psychrotolerans]ONN69796.1 7-carboxy-7-deazaguanine synthase QueE [Pseudomonas psychrotolerans]